MHTNPCTGPWWLLEILPHRFYDKDLGKQYRRIPLGAHRILPEDAIVHPSAVERMDNPSYRYAPPNVPRGKLQQIETLLPGENPRNRGMYRYSKGKQDLPRAAPPTRFARAAVAAFALVGGGILLSRKGR